MKLVAVEFNNNQIEVIEETQSVVISDICEALGINSSSQKRKLQADESYESKLIKVQTRGGLQEVFTIPLSKLNGWLFSINPNKVKPEVKQKLIEYKKECFNVLNNYFNQGIAVNHRLSSQPNLQKVIAGLKSGMMKKDKKIERLESQLHAQQKQDNQNTNIDEIIREVKAALGVKDTASLDALEHNSLFEIIFQIKSFQAELYEFEKVAKSRQNSIDNFMKVFEKRYPRAKSYIEELGSKKLGSIRTRF